MSYQIHCMSAIICTLIYTCIVVRIKRCVHQCIFASASNTLRTAFLLLLRRAWHFFVFLLLGGGGGIWYLEAADTPFPHTQKKTHTQKTHTKKHTQKPKTTTTTITKTRIMTTTTITKHKKQKKSCHLQNNWKLFALIAQHAKKRSLPPPMVTKTHFSAHLFQKWLYNSFILYIITKLPYPN